MTDTQPKSPEYEAAELRKLEAEARKAEIEADKAEHELEMDRYFDQRRIRENHAKDAVDERHGVYYFANSVSGSSVKACREWLNEWRRTNPGEPVTIVLNSPGGSVFDGFDLMDCIAEAKDAGHHVTTVIAGMAASMAGVVAQLGDDRVIGRHSRLHAHEVATGSIGKASDLKDTAELARSLTHQICQVYADRARQAIGDRAMTADEIFDWIERQERWLTAAEAIELGFADRIG